MRDTVTIEEIDKWLDRIEAIVDKIEVFDTKGEEMLTNMNAYISDCKHFKENGDLVKSFEAVIWSWAILELCTELGIFKQIVE
ncbi:MAG: DUF357 domain-containing protein [Nanoarchaeota archaeon]|nr:DUF357 domain-containing protein [Nanoarchaeota archaeon]